MYIKFKKDLIIGQKYEKIAIEAILKFYKFKYTLLHTNDTNAYDFMLSNDRKYEVKACLQAVKYNSIYVENTAFGKPSGILVTEANFYIFVICDNSIVSNILKISVNRLKRLIKEKYYYKYHQDELKSGYLFNLSSFKDKCISLHSE
jgi:hypothetical protein